MNDLVAKADGFAAAAHHAQTDKSGQPYIGHCRRVAARMSDPILAATGRTASSLH